MAYGVGYQGIGIYPMGPGGPMIPYPHMKDRDEPDYQTRRPRQTETWSPTPGPEARPDSEAKLRLAIARDPQFGERLHGLAAESDIQWQRVGNPETWAKAGLSKEDMVALTEQAEADMERRMRQSGTDRGEAAYLAQASVLSHWAQQHLEGATPEQLPALQDMAQGGQAYLLSREEFLRLKAEAGME